MEDNATPTLGDLYKGFGITPPGETTPEAQTEEEPEQTSSEETESTEPQQEQPQSEEPKEQPKAVQTAEPKPSKTDQQSAAFAQLRVQNKEYQNIVNGVAGILGVKDTSNPESVMAKLNELVMQAKAKEAGVPEELYKRLQLLEQRDQEYTQSQLKTQAYLGFQKVKDAYKLDDSQLQQFAADVSSAGNNPFEKPVDLLREYRMMHFEELLQAEREAGAKAEAARAAKVAAHSSTPNKHSGPGGSSSPEKINSVTQLADWMNKHKA